LFEIDVSEIVGHDGDEPDGVVDLLDTGALTGARFNPSL
jgi:hypothetical protein